MENNIRFTQPSLLIVEGKDEQNFFAKLAETLHVENLQILANYGKSGIRARLKALTKAPGFKSEVKKIGVVRDADDDYAGAFQSVRDALLSAALPAPTLPMVLAGRDPETCIMILPGNTRNGMLEDICLSSVQNAPVMQCVESYFECIRTTCPELRPNGPKARLQAFLSSQRETVYHLGEAAAKGYFPFDNPAFDEVKQLIKLLA